MEKTYEVTFQTLLSAVKHQWKVFLICVLCFALLGAALGGFYAKRLAADGGGHADSLKIVESEQVEKDANYYWHYIELMRTRQEELTEVLEYFIEEITMTTEQLSQINHYYGQLEDWADTTFLFARQYCINCVPERYLAVEQNKINTALMELEQKLKTAMPEKLQSLQLRENAYKDMARYLDGENAAETSRIAEMLLNDAADQLNELIEAVNQSAQEIAEINHIELTLEYVEQKDGSEQMTLSYVHSNRAVTPQENFRVIVLFCILLGIATGTYIVVCRQIKGCKAICVS